MKENEMHEEMWGGRGGGPRGGGRGRGPRRGGWGGPPPEFMRGGPGGLGPFGGGGGRGRGPRVRRGDVRAAALSLLAEGPRNGYQIIQEISERTDGVWRPSPGSVYPALQQLEDEGLIRPETGESGRKGFGRTGARRGARPARPRFTAAAAPLGSGADVKGGSISGCTDRPGGRRFRPGGFRG